MATVIDSLLVTLGLDASGFQKNAKGVTAAQKGIGKQSEKMAKDVKASAKEMTDGLRSVRNELLAFLGAIAGANGIKNFIVNTISANSALERTSRNLGMSAKELAAWQLANEKAGGSIEGMTAQLKESAEAAAKFRGGQGIAEGMKWLQFYAGKEIDADTLKDQTKYLLARADAIKHVRETQGEAAGMLAAKNMGISEDTYNLLKQGSSAVDQLRREQDKLAEAQAKNAPKAEELRQKWNDLTHQFEAMAIQIMPQLIPILEKFANWLISVIPQIESFTRDLDATLEPIGGVKTLIAALIGLKIAAFTKDLLGLAGALGQVGGSASILGRLGLIGAAGAGGWAIGQEINKHLTDEDKNDIGRFVAKTMALFGSKEAKEALAINEGGKLPSNVTPIRPRASSAGLPRGMRNNNPGNIEYGKFAIAHGATGSDGRFAIFPTMEAGKAAQRALLSGYLAKGTDTIGKVIAKYAPAGENNTSAYAAAVAKRTGIGVNDKLTESQIAAVSDAMFRHENGAAWDQRKVLAAANLPSGASIAARATGTVSNSNSATDIKINNVTIQTQATDAKGIAGDFMSEMGKFNYATNANTGVA